MKAVSVFNVVKVARKLLYPAHGRGSEPPSHGRGGGGVDDGPPRELEK